MNIKKYQRGYVFSPEIKENRKNTITAILSTNEGKDIEGNYKWRSWRAYFVGAAFEKAKKLCDKECIFIMDGTVTYDYLKEKNRVYNKVIIFDYDWADEKTKFTEEDNKKAPSPEPQETFEELPNEEKETF